MTIEVGASATRTITFTDDDVRAFAQTTGDANPIHVDEDYAAETRFGRRIVHGMLTASLISATIANDLPGVGSIYVSQTLQFKAPVFIGETITATVEVTAVQRRFVTLATRCAKQDGTLVIDGEAVVLLP